MEKMLRLQIEHELKEEMEAIQKREVNEQILYTLIIHLLILERFEGTLHQLGENTGTKNLASRRNGEKIGKNWDIQK